VFIWARKQKQDGNPVFKRGEGWVASLLVICALVAIYVFTRGLVSL